MNRRGISAQPVLNGYCGDYEYGMEKSVVLAPEFNYFPTVNSKISYTLPFNSQTAMNSNVYILFSLLAFRSLFN